MKLTVVGGSPAWPNPGGAHSGYLVSSEGGRLLLDCGPGVLARLRKVEAWPRVAAIAISHFHLDHCGDLVPWLWGHLLGPVKGTPGPELWLPPDGRQRLELLSRGAHWDRAFSIREYAEGIPFDAAGVRVLPRRVPHYDEPTWGFRIEHEGSALAYSADSGPSPVLEELARAADVFLCEATLLEPEQDPHGHLTEAEARDAARRAGARRLLLTHRSVEHPLEELVYEGLEVEL
ncbi:MAG: MBL fold metallo-hydrolase [Actinobacteria bacterium]|nr:MBL fold metallo-hydrolase [Actinomycetota bacterium]